MLANMNRLVVNIIHESGCDRRAVNELIAEAVEVVVFGSRAVGAHGASSDLDLLVITPYKRRVISHGLDCVLLNPEEAENAFWLGSELASHIAKYGLWVSGRDDWKSKVRISDRAIIRKQDRISSILRSAAQRWQRLHPLFQTKYRITLRRELQRLNLLVRGMPVPPTPILDAEWNTPVHSGQDLFALASDHYFLESRHAELAYALETVWPTSVDSQREAVTAGRSPHMGCS